MYNMILDNIYRMLPFLTMACSLVYGIAKHSGVAIYYAVAMLTADATCWFLKHGVFENIYKSLGKDTLPIIGRGPRPLGATNCNFLPDTSGVPATSFGMPSGHTCDIFLFATFWSLYIHHETNWSPLVRVSAQVGLFAIALLEGRSRITLGCHTWGQVWVGSLFGISFGILAYIIWSRRGSVVRILKQFGGKYLGIR